MTDQKVMGFKPCLSCTTLTFELVLRKTGGVCADCWASYFESQLTQIETRIEGQTYPVTVKRGRPRDVEARQRERKRYRSKPQAKANRAKAKLASARAQRRLRKLFPDLYAALYALERRNLGLHDWTIDSLLEPGDVQSSLEHVLSYHSLPEIS